MRINVLSKVLPLAIASLVLVLAGCATPYQPAAVTSTAIENSSVGYKGYTLEIPPGFKAGEAKKTGPDVPLWADVGAAMFNGRMKQELGVRFSESYFIYDPKVVVFFAMIVVDTRDGTLSMLDDRQANRILLAEVNSLFGKNSQTIGKTELIRENKHRGACAVGTFKPKGQEELSFHYYVTLGEMNEIYFIFGTSDPKDKEALAAATKQVYRTLKF
mgnify:CR=1 FL=1